MKTFAIILLILISCEHRVRTDEDRRAGLIKLDFDSTPTPPLIVIEKYHWAGPNWKIVYTDSTGQRYYFEVNKKHKDDYTIGKRFTYTGNEE